VTHVTAISKVLNLAITQYEDIEWTANQVADPPRQLGGTVGSKLDNKLLHLP
jgi:hypothetical protein